MGTLEEGVKMPAHVRSKALAGGDSPQGPWGPAGWTGLHRAPTPRDTDTYPLLWLKRVCSLFKLSFPLVCVCFKNILKICYMVSAAILKHHLSKENSVKEWSLPVASRATLSHSSVICPEAALHG